MLVFQKGDLPLDFTTDAIEALRHSEVLQSIMLLHSAVKYSDHRSDDGVFFVKNM